MIADIINNEKIHQPFNKFLKKVTILEVLRGWRPGYRDQVSKHSVLEFEVCRVKH